MSAPAASPAQQLLEHPVAQSVRWFDHLRRIDWSAQGIDWGLRAALALVLLIAGIWLSKQIARVLAGGLGRLGVDGILATFLRNVIRTLCLIVVVVLVMEVLGLPTTSLLAVVGAAGLGIGLALKDSLANVASGLMLITQRPFRAGDEVQLAGLTGVVEQVRIFQTVLRSPDNRVIVLPNSLITTAPIVNFTARERRRIEIGLGIGYGDDIAGARQTLIALAGAHPGVLADPKPDVLVTDLADSGVKLVLRAWVATGDGTLVASELREAIRGAIGERGLSIPYPRQNLHVFHHGVADAAQGEHLLAQHARNTPPQA
ncbi:MAG: mechanosensitive ion channel family protein [Proteobacteria bacterium]|nr:mechanosensitive ion channel family protein [Pseudomonadota bacterium]